jgi:hypothetical protein
MRLPLLLVLLPAALPAQSSAPLPVDAVRTGTFQDPALTESSGVARSRTMPGVLYSINDSGNPPILFATDTAGRSLGRWTVPGIQNRDWEALAIGPCSASSCLYIADTGDNQEQRTTARLYRLREPTGLARFRGAPDATPLELDSVTVQYPDGPHDVEAIWIDATGAIMLVSKGRSGGVRLYRVRPDSRARNPVRAELLQILPIVPDQRLGRWVTDAARSPDGRTVAIRTYTELYLFPQAGPSRLGTPTVCSLAGLEPQGEGVEWLDDRRLVLTSEAPFGAAAGLLHVVRCGG